VGVSLTTTSAESDTSPPRSRAALPPAGTERLRPATGLGRRLWVLADVRWAVLAALLFGLGGLAWALGAPAPAWWALFLACYAAGGWAPARDGLAALRERTLDVDLLMIVAAVVAAAIGQVVDGGLLIVIFATSGALETVATERTAASVRALLDLAPERATRIRRAHAAADVEETVDTAALAVGDVILIRPGERVGADAVVLSGMSDCDQATITGEPLPVAKAAGDELFAGTVNGTGALTARVARAADESVLARIVALVEEASATKARTQLFIEKVEQRYSVGVVAATTLLFVLPLLVGGALRPTLLRAMTFMIVASPCAVVLATMPPLLSAIALAGRHGVLVKSAVAMEHLADVELTAFDKTGTLTEGCPHVTGLAVAPGWAETDVLRLAAAAEHASEHPVAGAILAAAVDREIVLPPAGDFASTPGRGVTATVAGHRVAVASPAMLGELVDAVRAPTEDDMSWARAAVDAVWEERQTAVVVVVDARPVGVVALADRIRIAAAPAVGALTRLTGTPPALLTGDHQAVAEKLAAGLGLGAVHADLLPADKAEHVRALGTRAEGAGRTVLLVGDGVNDAPALAAAEVGVAMGRGGSDLALQTADVVLVHDDLAALPAVLAVARRARRVVAANLVIAACFITGLVVWDLAGHLPLPLGVAGHEGSTVIVGLNGLRLLRASVWRRAAES
jgi:heavy metal translocating P-type ATPase